MAKGKGGSGTSYTSKGERRNVAKSTTKGMKRDRSEGEKAMYAMNAYLSGRKVKKYGLQDLPEARFNKYGMKSK